MSNERIPLSLVLKGLPGPMDLGQNRLPVGLPAVLSRVFVPLRQVRHGGIGQLLMPAKLPVRTQSCVSSAKDRSTSFRHKLEVRVKCMWKRLYRPSQACPWRAGACRSCP